MSTGPLRLPPEADLASWIIEQSLTGPSLSSLIEGLCERLNGLGVPVWRAYVALPMVSPELRGMNHYWVRGQGASREGVRHDTYAGAFEASPFWPMLQDGVVVRRWPLGSLNGPTGFPVVDELREAGATDYVAHLVSFDATETHAMRGAAISFATDAPAGFDDGDLERLGRLVQLLGLAACRFATSDLVLDVLGAYVGRDAGRRVLSGEMRRGEGHRLTAALMFADLRGFTSASETGGQDLIPRLGSHLAAMAEPVEEVGGEVLKFLGDGLLAAFPAAEGDPTAACAAMLRAAREALRRNAALNATLPEDLRLDLDVALHLGQVFYGNVGAGSRLDFTVIGPAVNEAARLEALSGELGHALLMSEPFARACGCPAIGLGRHRLRGVSAPREVFTLPADPA